MTEYQSKWREVSVGWGDFEQTLAAESLDLSEAELARADNGIAFRAGGNTGKTDNWHWIFVRAGNLEVRRTDGEPCDLDALIALGDGYWDSGGNR